MIISVMLKDWIFFFDLTQEIKDWVRILIIQCPSFVVYIDVVGSIAPLQLICLVRASSSFRS